MKTIKDILERVKNWFKWLKINSVDTSLSLLENISLEPEQVQRIEKIIEKYHD
ncbi:hypothetical protein ACX1NA_03355 [Mycoplasma sp. VS276A1]